MISRLSQQFKNQEKFDFKIQEKMNLAQFCFSKEFSQNFLSYQSFYSLLIDYQFPVIDYQWQSLISKVFN